MKTAKFFRPAVMLALLFGLSIPAKAQPPAPKPATLWRFLGIPQAVERIRDGAVNRRGNHPEWERKPPLKALANPANLESPNPAVKAAAQIKAEEDLKAQKVKAIKYLAEVGCGCYPGVKEALLAALDDCTEEVRYRAAIAFCEASGNPCTVCNPGSCCDEEVMKKLKDIAFGQDEKGCWKETSPRVRAAAQKALNACEMVAPAAPAPKPKELPTEAPPKEVPFLEERAWEGPSPAPFREDEAWVEDEGSLIVNPVSMSQMAEATDEPSLDAIAACEPGCSASRFELGFGRRLRGRRPCRVYEELEPEEALAPEEAVPGEAAIEEPLYPPSTALAGTFGAATGPQSVIPNMIGDSFAGVGGGFMIVQPPAGVDQIPPNPIVVPTPRPGSNVVGRMKIAEDTSPIPRDRFLFDYNYFDNVPLYAGGVDVSRFTPGFEKTFLDGLTSLELKIPMAVTLDNHILADGPTDVHSEEFGNMAITGKALLLRTRRYAVSMGMRVSVPTAEDFRVNMANGTPLVRIENESVLLGPFVGGLWTPNNRFYAQGFLQWDVDVNGSPTYTNDIDGNGMALRGTLQDITFQYADIGAGYWVYRAEDQFSRLRGVSLTGELHWNTSLNDADTLQFDRFLVGYPTRNIDVFNATVGAHVVIGSTFITAGYNVPIGNSMDQEFDGELRIMINRYFGRTAREMVPSL